MPLPIHPRIARYSLLLLLVLLALTAWQPAQARVIPDLYEVMEAVSSRGATDRAAAGRRGLERVFVRVTGDQGIGANPQLAPELDKARNYLQVYRYETQDNQLYLHLSYDPKAVNDLVHRLQLPLWPTDRPSTLVWMAVDTLQYGRDTLRQENYPELFGLLDGLALERGLPLDFPVMDLNDQRNMSLGSLWAQDEAAAQRAGVRYRPDATLMGRLLQTSGQRWQANWLLIHGGRSYAFDASGESMEEVALRGVNEAASRLAERYAVQAGGADGVARAVLVEISGIDSFADYSGATRYLQTMAQVNSAEVIAVNGDRLTVSLTTASQLDSLRDALALNRSLRLADDGPVDLTGYRAPAGSAQNPLRYNWQ